MINILPPELKSQIKYSKLNVTIMHYLLAVFGIITVVTAALLISHHYADLQIRSFEDRLVKQTVIAGAYQEDLKNISTFNTQLKTIGSLLKTNASFSGILQDLAAVLPKNSYLAGITLTGDNSEPLELLVTAPTRRDAITVRNALLTSERIATADIQSINDNGNDDGVTVSLIVAFKQEKTQ